MCCGRDSYCNNPSLQTRMNPLPHDWRGRVWTRQELVLRSCETSCSLSARLAHIADPVDAGHAYLPDLHASAGCSGWAANRADRRILALCPGKGQLQSVRSRRLSTGWCVCASMAYGVRRRVRNYYPTTRNRSLLVRCSAGRRSGPLCWPGRRGLAHSGSGPAVAVPGPGWPGITKGCR